MEYVFLGGIFPEERVAKDILSRSRGSVQYAADLFQKLLIEGIEENLNQDIKVLNSMFVYPFPTGHRNLIIPSFSFSHKENAEDYNCGVINLFGINYFTRYLNLRKQLRRRYRGKEVTIFVYAMHAPFLHAVKSLRKIAKVRLVLICPDLPEYMNTSTNSSLIYKFLKYIDVLLINTSLDAVDSFVYITKYMNERINTFKKPYTVIEGIASSKEIKKKDEDEKTRVMYSGTLHKRYGVKRLLDAFLLCKNENLELLICGVGDFEVEIAKYLERDSRIKYFGEISQTEVFDLQANADILVNPRQNNEEFTKYSFPSKLMEYLASGNPVIAYKLDGIPHEYDDYLIYVPDDSISSLANSIDKLADMPVEQRERIGKRNRDFVLKYKNSAVQTKKIIDMLKKQ
jgi:Glycosyltransferase